MQQSESTHLEIVASIYSDIFKDVNGFRPRHDVSGWNEADFQSAINNLQEELEVIIKEEAHTEKILVEQFEASVQNVINFGAGDRKTALRWLMDASEADGDWEYFCYLNGIPYGYFKEEV